ncbi:MULTISPECIES: hypothetical protein [Photobacterium]|jgi:hypothetical protein|uniref:hypothetical protein n=1 Tax=Photobacterium TaxID=657 RepID=UPI000AF3B465|nr:MULTISPECIES: hypothetical protein [Photobacterium]MCG7587022.1 hypothetical protein [Photobacterium sp. OFAV2-7]
MHTPQLSTKEIDNAIAALGECYRRLNAAEMTAKELSQDGFTLMFKSAYEDLSKRH